MNSKPENIAPSSREFPASASTMEAARRLGVTVPTIQRWLDQGVLRGWKTAGGHRRIELDSLNEYVAKRLQVLSEPGPADVLIVDDDPAGREFLRSVLSTASSQFRVREARDGFAAISEVTRSVPALLVADIRMPHMDGVAFLRHVLNAHPELRGRVMAVSSGPGTELWALGDLRAQIRFMGKPLDADEVLAVLSTMIKSVR